MRIVVLDHPRVTSMVHYNDIANTPLWSCVISGYVTACLEKGGHDVIFMDALKLGWDFIQTKEAVLGVQPDLISVNAVYFWENTGQLFEFLSDLKKCLPDVHLNLFGFFPSLIYNDLLQQEPTVDSIAVGECEWTLVELAACLQSGENWQDIAGVASRIEGKPKLAKNREPEVNPDRFPFPHRGFNGVSQNEGCSVIEKLPSTASVLASRGCYNHCSFCPIPSFYNQGPLWCGRSPENVVGEVAELVEQGYQDIYFVDPNFIGPGQRGRRRALDLAERIKTLGITFGMETRPNDFDDNLIERMREAGLKTLLLGIEGGSAAVLGNLNKSSSVAVGEKAINACRAVGLEPEIGFLMFTPDATWADIRRNYSFLIKLDLLDRLERTANLLGHRQIVIKGTSSYLRFQKEGRLKPNGLLGMEGQIAYKDSMVNWMADIFGPVCRQIHIEMGLPTSPIYWRRNPGNPVFKQVNDYLVKTFAHLLDVAALECRRRSVDDMRLSAAAMRQRLEEDISDLLVASKTTRV